MSIEKVLVAEHKKTPKFYDVDTGKFTAIKKRAEFHVK
jgi:hypothetical protein